jgi:hypothetical protein
MALFDHWRFGIDHHLPLNTHTSHMERPKSDEEARIWNSSKTALRIRDLGDVEKV